MPGLDNARPADRSAGDSRSTLVRDSGMVAKRSGGKRGLNQHPKRMRRGRRK